MYRSKTDLSENEIGLLLRFSSHNKACGKVHVRPLRLKALSEAAIVFWPEPLFPGLAEETDSRNRLKYDFSEDEIKNTAELTKVCALFMRHFERR